VPSRDIKTEHTPRGRLDPKARLKIGHELRATYKDCSEWEPSKRLRDLLEQLGVVDPRPYGR
jgi:hypothetical protein